MNTKNLEIKIPFLLFAFTCLALQGKCQQNDPKFGTIKVQKYEEQQFFIEIDYVPKYISGSDALLDDIHNGIEYPEEALVKKLKGTVMVKVVIDKFGNVTHTSIHSSPNSIFNKAALASAKKLKKFEPHRVNEMEVPAQFILPVRFILPL